MKLADWFPAHPPLYDIRKTYLDNALHGPFFSGKIPERKFPPKEKWIDFLGYKIASRIGIPAGPLLTARWIALAAALGFDVPTYKTIRSKEHAAHPLPNMVYVDTHGMVAVRDGEKAALLIEHPSKNINDLAVTNSFGMPSMSPQFLMEDIERANAALKPGQVMIVSVVGTPRPGEIFRDDFCAAARLAKEGGAKIIEANFSCPNVEKKEGSLYLSPESVLEIGKALMREIGSVPLILKMGIFPNKEQMRNVLVAAARSGARAVCGINTISMRVVDEKGAPALGEKRVTSGICGGPIRNAALHFLKEASQIIRQEKLGLTLLGCGGITLPEHFDLFFEAGADIALTATGMMWDPYLALRKG